MVNDITDLLIIRHLVVSVHRVFTISHHLGRSIFFTISHNDIIFMMVTEMISVSCAITGVTTIDHCSYLFDFRTSRLVVYCLINVRHLDGADRFGQ